MINVKLYERIIQDFLQGENILPKDPITLNSLSECYKKNNDQLAEVMNNTENLFLALTNKTRKGFFRIMSWNVRYWTTVDNRPSIDQIYEVISKLNPDIICLQEMTLGNNDYYGEKQTLFQEMYTKLTDKYKVISVCFATPSWYADVYGNAILIEKTLYTRLWSLNRSYIFGDKLCDVNRNKCFYNQQSHTYYHIPPTNDITRNAEKLRYQNMANENKCYIKLSFPIFDLICVHLDAYSILTRIKQLDIINSEITRPTIIIGDFNFFNYDDLQALNKTSDFVVYTIGYHQQRGNNVITNQEYRHIIDELKWTDTIPPIHLYYSQWALTRVDHIFTAKLNSNQPLNPYAYFYPSNATDHLPLIFQIYMGNYGSNPHQAKKNIYQNDAFYSQIMPMPPMPQMPPMARTVSGDAHEKTYSSAIVTNMTDNDIQLFNGQPILAFDWISADGKFNSKYGMNDPFLTGNANMALGNNGLYTATYLLQAFSFANTIINNVVNFTTAERSWGLNLVYLLFTFRCEKNNELKMIQQSLLTPPIEIIDEKYDIVCIYRSRSDDIWKFTPRKYNKTSETYPHLFAQKMTIMVGRRRVNAEGNTVIYSDEIEPLLKIRPSYYKAATNEDENALDQFVARTQPQVVDDDHQLTHNWKNIVIVLKNAVDWINDHRTSGPIIAFDWRKIRVYDRSPIFEGIAYNVIYQPQQTGGSYFHKYLKYKHKYLATKQLFAFK